MAPRHVEILGRSDGEDVEVAEGESLTLDCVVRDARPAPGANWLRDDVPLAQGECHHLNFFSGLFTSQLVNLRVVMLLYLFSEEVPAF